MMTRCLLGASVVALAVWSTPALADESAPPNEDGTVLLAQARELYREGFAAEKQKQWERARLFYLSAYRAQPHFQIAVHLGLAELELGRFRDAAEHLDFFLRETRDLPGADAWGRASVEQAYSRARERAATLVVSADPPGAEVLVDGSPVGNAPIAAPIFVEPGRHLVEVKLAGYVPTSNGYDLLAGTESRVSAHLTPAAAPVRVSVVAPPPPPPRAPAPVTRVRVNKVAVAGFALAGVAAGFGVGFAAVSGAKASASADCEVKACEGFTTVAGRRDEFNDLQSQKTAFGAAAVGSFIGAGLLAGGTLTYTLVRNKQKLPARTGVSVYPGGAAASVSLEW
jgi:hypothetical protein